MKLQTMTLTAMVPDPAGGDAGQLDIHVTFLNDPDPANPKQHPSVAVVGQGRLAGVRCEPDNLQVTWQEAEPDRVLLETVGLLNMLARGIVPANLAVQAANLVNQLAERPDTLASLGLSPSMLPGVQP